MTANVRRLRGLKGTVGKRYNFIMVVLWAFSHLSDLRTAHYVMVSSYCYSTGESVLYCSQTFHLRGVDALEKGITVVELGMNNRVG